MSGRLRRGRTRLRDRLRRLLLRDRREDLGVVRVLSWNAEVGRDPNAVVAALWELIDAQGHPEVVALQEARGYVRALRSSLRGFYVVHAATGWEEAANCITLVRADLVTPHVRAIRLVHGWRGPKMGKRKPGRTFLVTDVGSRDTGWRFVNVHLTRDEWGTDANDEAYAALLRLSRRPGSHNRALAILGDLNEPIDDHSGRTPAALAKEIGASKVDAGGGVDWAIVRGATGVGARLRHHGSDHPARVYALTHNSPARRADTGTGAA